MDMIIGTMRTEESKVFDCMAGYHQFHAEETQEPYGSFEVFWDDGDKGRNYDSEGEEVRPGWYWASGFPGCTWDSEPVGPFATSMQAHKDADEWSPEYDD
jgi:hypothetical protein